MLRLPRAALPGAGDNDLPLVTISGTEKVIPEGTCDTEVYLRVLVMNLVMNPEFSIPSVFEVEMMMNVVKGAVEGEPSYQARQKS